MHGCVTSSAPEPHHRGPWQRDPQLMMPFSARIEGLEAVGYVCKAAQPGINASGVNGGTWSNRSIRLAFHLVSPLAKEGIFAEVVFNGIMCK